MTSAAVAVDARGLTGSQKAWTYALANIARSGATRSNYISGNVLVWIGGVWTAPAPGASRRVLVQSLTMADLLNERPNTCNFTVQGARPVEGSEVYIRLGSANNPSQLFAGNILRVTEVYAAQNPKNAKNILWQVECIDWTWKLNQRLVTWKYTNLTAKAILIDLHTRFAPPGYSTFAPDGLPLIDEISFTQVPFMEAVTQIAQRIGGYSQCDYQKVIAIWLHETIHLNPQPLTPAHPSLESFSYTRDLSQIVTRAIVEGGGVNATSDVNPGDRQIPVEDAAWYQSGGGLVMCGQQRLWYLGLNKGGDGSLIGTGATVTPSTAPEVVQAEGAGLPAGTYQYAYVWQSAAGMTTPSPVALGAVAAQVAAPTVQPILNGATTPPGTSAPGTEYFVCYQYTQDDAIPPLRHTPPTPRSASCIVSAAGSIGVRVPYSADTSVKWITLSRAAWNVPSMYLTGERIANVPTQAGIFSPEFVMTAAIAQTVDPANTTTPSGAQITLRGIATGPPGTVGRHVYRTAANSAQLRFHTTIADNSTTTMGVDTKADAALGANAPTTDTAGLISSAGQVQAGSTTIPVSSGTPFGTGGWAFVGPQLVRYGGVSGNTLISIPATGPGSLGTTVQHGTSITVAPQIFGLPASGAGAILFPIKQGDAVNLVVVHNDTAAQAALAALIGGDGVVEAFLADNRISEAEARSRADALLRQKKDPQLTIRYRTRDVSTRSGALIVVNLPAPVSVSATLRIQDVTIGGFLGTGEQPTLDATASSVRFTFEDLIRQSRTRWRPQGPG